MALAAHHHAGPWRRLRGISLFCPNRGAKELSAKLGAMTPNAWNSEKIIAFFENPLLLFRLKERSSKAPSLVSQPRVGASSRLISLLSLNNRR
jgi:hypothetical protein